MAALGQEQAPGPAVSRITAALNQTGIFHPVDHPGQRDRLHFQPFGIIALIFALGDVQDQQQPGLRAGHPQLAHPGIEGPPQQPRAIGQQVGQTQHATVIIDVLMISKSCESARTLLKGDCQI